VEKKYGGGKKFKKKRPRKSPQLLDGGHLLQGTMLGRKFEEGRKGVRFGQGGNSLNEEIRLVISRSPWTRHPKSHG